MKRRAFVMGVAGWAAERMDLFPLIGQSNRAGRGVVEEQDRTAIPGVMALGREREWAPAVDRTKAAMRDGVPRGIPWHQGEAERGKEELAWSYAERWLPMMAALPVVVGELGRFLKAEKQPYAGVVNEQLASLTLKGKRVGFVASEGLGHKGDELHFDGAGLRELGRRYAMAYAGLDGEWMP